MRPPFVQIQSVLHKVALAGGTAGALRFLVTQDGGWVPILVVNVVGCALLGVLMARRRASLPLAAGFCGGLTSFSALMVQARASAAGHGVPALGDAGVVLPAGAGGAILVLALHAGLGAVAFALARRLTPDSPTPGLSPA